MTLGTTKDKMIAIKEGTNIKARQSTKPNKAQASIKSNNVELSIKRNKVRTRADIRAETRDNVCVYARGNKCVQTRANVHGDPSDWDPCWGPVKPQDCRLVACWG